MDITADVVSTTATKIKLDKNFLLGAAAGVTLVAGAVLVKKAVDKVKDMRSENNEAETA